MEPPLPQFDDEFDYQSHILDRFLKLEEDADQEKRELKEKNEGLNNRVTHLYAQNQVLVSQVKSLRQKSLTSFIISLIASGALGFSVNFLTDTHGYNDPLGLVLGAFFLVLEGLAFWNSWK